MLILWKEDIGTSIGKLTQLDHVANCAHNEEAKANRLRDFDEFSLVRCQKEGVSLGSFWSFRRRKSSDALLLRKKMLEVKAVTPCPEFTYALCICSKTVYRLLENPWAHRPALATSQTCWKIKSVRYGEAMEGRGKAKAGEYVAKVSSKQMSYVQRQNKDSQLNA